MCLTPAAALGQLVVTSFAPGAAAGASCAGSVLKQVSTATGQTALSVGSACYALSDSQLDATASIVTLRAVASAEGGIASASPNAELDVVAPSRITGTVTLHEDGAQGGGSGIAFILDGIPVAVVSPGGGSQSVDFDASAGSALRIQAFLFVNSPIESSQTGVVTFTATPLSCPADVTTTNTNPGDAGSGEPDGEVNGADLSYYVELWLSGCP